MSRKDIGIDLGTANTLVYLKSKGIVLNEPSVVAADNDGNILAVGSEAKEMLGRTHQGIRAVRPLKDGVIADFEAAGAMLGYFIQKAIGKKGGFKPRAMICGPTGISAVERKAVEEAAAKVGVRSVYIMEEPMAAAIGAGVDVEAPQGSMIVDIGGGTSEVAVISLGGIVSWKTIRVAGDSHDEAISSYIRKKYSIQSGRHNAEEIKLKIGTVQKTNSEPKEIISGRNAVSGMPCSTYVTGSDVRCALIPQVSMIIDAIKSVLEDTPPELSADILKNGIVLTGGGSLLNGLDKVISGAVNIPVKIADDPLNCVVMGAGALIDGNLNGVNSHKRIF